MDIGKILRKLCEQKGVEIIDSTDKKIYDLYNELYNNKQILVEEIAVQCKKISDSIAYFFSVGIIIFSFSTSSFGFSMSK